MTLGERIAAALHVANEARDACLHMATMTAHWMGEIERDCEIQTSAVLAADPSIAADLELAEKAKVARAVAQVWLDVVMASDVLRSTGMSHPLAMVLAAFDGETDPVHLGCHPDALDNALREDAA